MVVLILGLLLGGGVLQAQEKASPLLVMISIDGLRPDYVTAADAHGAKVPSLRRFMKEGAYAEGVTGVVPTVTYPSHTTLVTGVWPTTHGIWGNTTFDPLQKNYQGWYWYAEDIRVATLWDAAAQAGRTTASIQWPVTVGAKITWNIPEFWRAGTAEDAKLLRAVSTRGLLEEAAAEIGEYRGGIDASAEGDEVRGKYAVWILEKKRPGLLTLHLTALDHIEHETGVFSAEDIATIGTAGRDYRESAGGGGARGAGSRDCGGGFRSWLRELRSAVESVCGVSRGEALYRGWEGKITDWRAMPWVTGGSAAIVLKDAQDKATLGEVRELLAKLAADPANGIDRVLEAEELHKRGGYPNASFFVSLKPGWRTGASIDGAGGGEGEAGRNARAVAGCAGAAGGVFRGGAGDTGGAGFGIDRYAGCGADAGEGGGAGVEGSRGEGGAAVGGVPFWERGSPLPRFF